MMTWYTVNMLISVKPKGYIDGNFRVMERMYLIDALTDEELTKKLCKLKSKIDSSFDNENNIIQKVIDWRQIVSIFHTWSEVDENDDIDINKSPPRSGTELTYYYYDVNEKDINDLINKKPVAIYLCSGSGPDGAELVDSLQ